MWSQPTHIVPCGESILLLRGEVPRRRELPWNRRPVSVEVYCFTNTNISPRTTSKSETHPGVGSILLQLEASRLWKLHRIWIFLTIELISSQPNFLVILKYFIIEPLSFQLFRGLLWWSPTEDLSHSARRWNYPRNRRSASVGLLNNLHHS